MCKKLIYLVCFVLVLGMVLTSRANAADPSLVGWWRLDEGSGTIAHDSSGNGNDGTFNGDPQWVAGHLGGALEFDGAGDYLDCGNDPSLDLTKWTIAFWLNINENKDYSGFVIKGVDNAENYEVLAYGAANFHFPMSNTDGARVYVNTATGVTVVGEWAHFAFSYDSAEGRRFYKDGSLIFEDTESSTPQTTAAPLIIGNEGGTSRFVNGIMDDIRIYNRALTEAEIQQAMVGRPVELAYGPSPANEATDVPREVVLSWEQGEFAAPTNGHKVYFGESFDDVNDATGSVAQTAASYALPERLDFGTTYYWRVDEVNAPPTSQIEFKGEVWQFTTEPIAYPIDGNNITATASSTNSAEEGPENTINSSGLDANGLHSTEPVGMWLSSALDPNAAWLQYEFDRVYKLHQMQVWNNNTLLEPVIGFGVKDATIEYSVDGNNYTTLGTTHEFARAPGAAGYAHNTTVDLGGVAVKYVRLTANSNWGGLLPQYGLSEVRFLYIPLRAREPQPESGATDVAVDVILGFRAGREAAERNVYLSSDEQAVIDGNAPVSTVTENSYSPSPLDVDSTYYWRVDEVNEAETPTMLEGDTWNFTTQEYLVVDDFESYNEIPVEEEGSNLVYLTWIDGYDNPSVNGSTMGHTVAFRPSMESVNVYDGGQSAPLYYDNSTAGYSEATANVAELQVGQDWTKHGIKALTLMFLGDPNNAAQQMYVKVNGSKVIYDGEAENIRRMVWQMWYIDLSSLGVSLSNVTELSIGFERSGAVGGQGVVYFDGIRLYSHDRQFIPPVEPSTAGLLGHYKLDGNANDSSGSGYNGTEIGSPIYVAGKFGQAIELDGVEDAVEVPSIGDYNEVSMVAWIKPAVDPTPTQYAQLYAHSAWAAGSLHWTINWGQMAPSTQHLGPAATDPTVLALNQWTHVALVQSQEKLAIYRDGSLAAETANSGTGPIIVGDGHIGAWSNADVLERFFPGLIDEFRIYDRVLSQEEVAWLAGRTEPFDKSF